jgi:hypothetical protein
MPRKPTPRRLEYRDRRDRVWYVSEVARLKVVSAAIDGPNLCLVIRFEREGEERFARWIGGENWHARRALHRLFTEAEPGDRAEPLEPSKAVDTPPAMSAPTQKTGVGPAPPETVALWVKAVASMGPDELADFEARTFEQWDRACLSVVRIAIDRRHRELTR